MPGQIKVEVRKQVRTVTVVVVSDKWLFVTENKTVLTQKEIRNDDRK
jgi:hypothetical protein